MACDRSRRPNQTISERKKEIRETVAKLAADLAGGRVKAIVGKQGGIVFEGWQVRNNVTDACALRLVLSTGSVLAKAKIAQAEALAGRSLDKRSIAQGLHTHDGVNWHHHKG